MKPRSVLLIFILLLASESAGIAWASPYHHHDGSHVGIHVGPIVGWNWQYPPPYYFAYPPIVAAPSTPPVYIERQIETELSAHTATSSNDWYYCRKPDGYYPYVKQCPGGWQRVPAHPPPEP